MRILLFCAALMTFLAAQTSFANIQTDIPEVVLTTFQSLYPDATDVSWDTYEDEYIASFENDGMFSEATFSAKGKQLETTTSLNESQLPESIQNYINENYAEEIEYYDSMSLIEKPGFVRYYVTLTTESNTVSLTFDGDGNLLKEDNE